jgi:hypothetical protein
MAEGAARVFEIALCLVHGRASNFPCAGHPRRRPLPRAALPRPSDLGIVSRSGRNEGSYCACKRRVASIFDCHSHLVLRRIRSGLLSRELAKKSSRSCQERCCGCGCKGGPGYRGPRGCVEWADLLSVCGDAPHADCKRECAAVVPACVGKAMGRAWLKALAMYGVRWEDFS